MGIGSSSADDKTVVNNSIRNENNTTIVNRSTLNQMTENINQKSTDTTMDAAKQCSSTTDVSNLIDFTGADVDGDFNLTGVDLSQQVEVNFSCIMNSEFSNTIASSIMEEVVKQYSNIQDDTIKEKLDAAAKTENENGFGSGFFSAAAGSETNTEIVNVSNYNSLSETEKNIHDITKNVISNTTSIKDSQDCLLDVKQRQGLNASGMTVGGNVNINDFKSEQVSTNFGNCVLESKMVNDVLDTVASKLGITIDETKTTAKETDSSGSTDSSNTNLGIGGAIGKGAEGIGSGVATAAKGVGEGGAKLLESAGELVKAVSPFTALANGAIMCGIALVIVVILCVIMGKSGSENDNEEDMDEEDMDEYDEYDDNEDEQYGGFTSSNTSYLHEFITDSTTSL